MNLVQSQYGRGHRIEGDGLLDRPPVALDGTLCGQPVLVLAHAVDCGALLWKVANVAGMHTHIIDQAGNFDA